MRQKLLDQISCQPYNLELFMANYRLSCAGLIRGNRRGDRSSSRRVIFFRYR